MASASLTSWAHAVVEQKKARADGAPPALTKMTIVVPSFCRQDYLLRQAVYWAYSRATVVIVDGSPEAIDVRSAKLIAELPNVRYLNLFESYAHRLRVACRDIRTPYAMCLADDDFFLMHGLGAAIERLERDGSAVACIGQCVAVDFDHQEQRGYFFPYGRSLWKYEVKHPDAAERIRLGMSAYRSATSYAVFRAPAFRELWQKLQMTSCVEVSEYEHAIGTYTLGGLQSVDDLYWIRSFECEPVDSSIDGSRKLDFATWWVSGEHEKERAEFVSRQADRLREHSSLNRSEAERVIVESMNFILGGKSTGLMNELPISSLVNHFSKFVRSSPYLDRLRSTRIGIAIRNRIRNQVREALRSSPAAPAACPGSANAGHPEQEREEILAFMSGFYAARQPADPRFQLQSIQ